MEKRIKILVIDDDEAILEVITYILKDEGYDVLASDGSDVEEKIGSFVPDLIILDVLLSGKNGIDICSSLKQNPLTAHIPVIMFSAHSDGSKISQQCGADAFMEKPFEIEKLTRLINRVLKKKKN